MKMQLLLFVLVCTYQSLALGQTTSKVVVSSGNPQFVPSAHQTVTAPMFVHADYEMIEFSQVAGDDSASTTSRYLTDNNLDQFMIDLNESLVSQGWGVQTTQRTQAVSVVTWTKGNRVMQTVLVEAARKQHGYTLVVVMTI